MRSLSSNDLTTNEILSRVSYLFGPEIIKQLIQDEVRKQVLENLFFSFAAVLTFINANFPRLDFQVRRYVQYWYFTSL